MNLFDKRLQYLTIILILINSCLSALKPDCKNHLKTKYDSFVCVCTESQPCDRIEAPVKTAPAVVTRWQSSRDGARLRKETFHFGNKSDEPIVYADGKTGQLHIKVNRDVKHQEIFGFGGAFTDSTGYNLVKIGSKLSDHIMRDYFSKDGLEYNVGRLPIGGSDFSTRGYVYDNDVIDKTLQKFNLTQEDFDYKIPFVKKAQSLATHEIRLFASPWTAPKWMKTNNNIGNGGSIKGAVGTEFWQIYAKYFVHYLNAYKAHNITHWGITVQNEPKVIQKYNTMYYSPEMMRDFLAKTLGPELERSGWGSQRLKVMIYDDNLDRVQEYVKTIFGDKDALKYAAGIAIHWYSGSPKKLLDEPHKQHPDKFILATEACVMYGVKLGSWATAERYATDILDDLLHHTIGWTDWNMVLDTRGGPNWVNNFVDAPVIIDPEHHQYYRQPHFYAMAHFSKYLPPGSVRIDSQTVSEHNTKAIVGAFRTPHNSTVIIAVNNEDIVIEFTLEDTRAGKLSVKIDPRSIHTFVYYD